MIQQNYHGPADVAPSLEGALSKLLEHGFIRLSIRQKALEAGVLQFKLLKAFALCGFHPVVQMLPMVVGRRRSL